jgi:hypothetical protein
MTDLNDVKFSGDNVLTCPHCGFDYLHQGAARIYGRGEDDAQTVVTTVDEQGSATARVASEYTRNPSGRRHGLAIAFGCNKEARIVARLLVERHASRVAHDEGVSFAKVWRLADREWRAPKA